MRELTEAEKRRKAINLWEEAVALLHNAYHKADLTSRLTRNRTALVVEQTALALDKIEEAMSLGFSAIVDEDIARKEAEREAKRKESMAQKYPDGDVRNLIKVKEGL